MRLRRKSLQPKSAEEPSDVPALLIECQHVAVLSASRPVVWYVVGLVRPAKTAPKQTKRCVPHSRRTASDILEEGGDDVKSAWPLWAGPHTCYNGNYNGKQGCKAERIRKDCLSSDCSLQLGNMKLESLVAVGEPVAGLNPSRWKFPSRCLLPLVAGGRRVQRTRSRGASHKIQEFHFPSCSSIGNQDKPGTTVRRENTRSHSDLDMWNRLAPYVLRLFGRHGPSPVRG
ncbi:hypothetical protein L1887_53384 [Cichorium endivia]|nr:hypothetical protein L1887_61548 [Cichorium endivia]KAI3483736.1 hypothetical protein L1887_53384 [Cichorium endivia]